MVMSYVVGTALEDSIIDLMFGGSGALYLFGPWMPITGVLLLLCVLDIITGVAKGLYDRNLVSRKMSQGMVSKASMFVVIIIANMLDMAVSPGMPIVKTSVILFYTSLEMISILENLGQMGVKMPPVIKEYLAVLKKKEEDSKK